MCFLIPLLLVIALLLLPRALIRLRERLSPREFAGDDCFVTVAGHAIHYQDEGPRGAPAVVLLHGFGAWSFTWRAQRAALLAAGYRVIATDQIGYGGSDRPAAPIYTTETQAELILGVLDALGVGAAHLVGHSFGARVAMQIALAAPARARSLVLVAPEAFATERPPIGKLAALPLLGFALAYYSLAPRLVRPGLKYVSRRHDWLTDEAVAGYAAPMRVRGTAAAQVWQARSPKDGARAVPAHLREIAAPALVIWGAADPVFPVADARRLAEILPNARLEIAEGAGHLPHEESRAEVTSSILRFLSDSSW